MARKKYEFKPDPRDSGFLNKLYLTQKQRLAVLRWLAFVALGIILLVVQDTVLCRFRPTTDLIPCYILAVCVLLGPEEGGAFALAASMLYQFSGSGPGYHVILLLTVLGIAAAILRQAYLRKGFSATLLCAGAALMIYEICVFLFAMLLGLTNLARFGSCLATGALSWLAMPLIYPIAAVIGKIGGESWKE